MAYQFPNYFQKTPVTSESPWAEQRWKVYNRTGGATVVGGVYMFDMAMSQAETTTYDWMDAASAWRNIVAQGTYTTDTGTATVPGNYAGFFCVATAAVADNAEFEVVVQGEVSMLTLAVNATQHFPKWTPILPTNGKTYGTINAGNSAFTVRQIGRTLSAYNLISATDTEQSLRTCFFSGFGMLV